MSQQPPDDAQLSADDPMLEQIEKATSGRTDDEPQEDDESQDAVGAEVGMGEPNTFEPEEVQQERAE